MNRLEQKYVETVKPSLMKEFNYSSSMEAPKIVKVVINMGVGDACLCLYPVRIPQERKEPYPQLTALILLVSSFSSSSL